MTYFEQHVLPLFEVNRADWLQQAREVARNLGERCGEVTIDDVRRLCPPPESIDPRVMGGVFKKSEWKLIRHQPSTRATCHHRLVAVFKLRTVS